jgi:hypothetical protein
MGSMAAGFLPRRGGGGKGCGRGLDLVQFCIDPQSIALDAPFRLLVLFISTAGWGNGLGIEKDASAQ